MAAYIVPMQRLTFMIIVVILAGTIEAAPTTPNGRPGLKLSTPASDATTKSRSNGCGMSNRDAGKTPPKVTNDLMLNTSSASELSLSDSVRNFTYNNDNLDFQSPLPSESPTIEAYVNQDTVDDSGAQYVTLEPTELQQTSGDIDCPDTAQESSTAPSEATTVTIRPSSTSKHTATKKVKASGHTLRSYPK